MIKILINKYKNKVLTCLLIGVIAILTVSMIGGVSAADKTITNATSGGLKVAIESVGDNETIFLENGVYSGENNTGISINKDLTISGKGSNVVIDAKGKSRIFAISSDTHASYKVTLKNLKLINGNEQYGGAIYIYHGSLVVSDCTFTNNQAKNGEGGAVYNDYGNLTISGSTFTDNQAKKGGAIYNDMIMNITGSYFMNNVAISGGAIYNNNRLSVKDSIFNGNIANGDLIPVYSGGAIHHGEGMLLSVFNSNFTNNKAQCGGAIGTGDYPSASFLLFENPKIVISDSLFENNHATHYGGAIILYPIGDEVYGNITLSITNSFFNNNYAESSGGAIYIDGESSFVDGRDIYKYKPQGGYDYETLTKCSVINSAFNNNKAYYDGGAIGGVNPAEIKITKTVFKNNIMVSKNIYNAIDPYLRVILSKDVSITPAE
ncbi:MAG: hypothetical protein LBU40_01600, partial [Methanobrevibacter sp.]|nr:hypothetical protein [Methanobrevibacter sp.]